MKDALALLLVFIVGLLVGAFARSGSDSEWQKRAEAAINRASEAEAMVDSLRAEADSLVESATIVADSARESEIVTDSILVTLPPPRTSAEALRDVVIESLKRERDLWHDAYLLQVRATARLDAALDTAMAEIDSLVSVLEDRPRPRPWWVPRFSVGPAAGVCDSNGLEFCKGVVAQLGWEISP